MSDTKKRELLSLLQEKERRMKYDKFHEFYFQDHMIDANGQDISRQYYKPHIELMQETAKYRELAFIAPNRAGKSDAGAFLITMHVTKDYPDWYKGKRFGDHEQVKFLVLGKSNLAVRDVAQKKLIGSIFDKGTGLLPKESICEDLCRKKMGTPDALQDLYVRDKFGTINHIQFMSYEIEEDVIMGQEIHGAWFDEECLKTKLYNEVLMRTMTTGGFVFTTFTPLEGFTDGIKRFMPDLTFPENGVVIEDNKPVGRFVVHCSWDDSPHLTEEMKADIKMRYTGAELIARTEGIPTIGIGQIYKYMPERITVAPFPIPIHWPRVYGLDVGWERTAGVWGAIEPESGIVYIYSEHYLGREPVPIHASAIRARGEWIPGVIDPASRASGQSDGLKLFDLYERERLDLSLADNAVSAGIYKVDNMFANGQLKVFTSCYNLISEIRVYRFDENGKVVKKHDHALDALRYLVMSGIQIAEPLPDPDLKAETPDYNSGRCSVTGY